MPGYSKLNLPPEYRAMTQLGAGGLGIKFGALRPAAPC